MVELSPAQWLRANAIFDDALDLPESERSDFARRSSADDLQVLAEVESLLHAARLAGDFLDTPAAPAAAEPTESLSPGERIGPWRIRRRIGRGGMGEVFEAERVDGGFRQRVAIKLLHTEAAAQLQRFHAERRILAGLEHPGIARLYDGGVAPDGRPYMVMEYVEGQPITEHCARNSAPLQQRLALFSQVCDAVAYAHRHLVVHRDLKPANILVTDDGQVKLLDFGIAKLLDAGQAEADDNPTLTAAAPLTPAYAAPEQLTGRPVTTATDVYALGALLYELLTGARPWAEPGAAIAQMLRAILERPAPAPSRTAAANAQAPITARLLRGDLDAIVAKCLRKEPAHRYATVNDLKLDIERHLASAPVTARAGARLYVFSRFLSRHWLPMSAVAAVFVALVAGIAGVVWQAQRAERAAARTTATKDFLISMFKASDPRVASDRPRGAITAKELLDLNAAKIASKFAADPDTQIELLGVTADIYRELGEAQQRSALRRQQVQLAREVYGDLHPAVLDGLLDQAREANARNDDAAALKILAEVDTLIRRAGRERSSDRARWWLNRALALDSDPSATSEHEAALESAVRLFSVVAPAHPEYVTALSDLGHLHNNRFEAAAAIPFFRQAIAVAEQIPDRDDAFLVNTHGNLGVALQHEGDFDAAEAEYAIASELARRTRGETGQTYWIVVTRRARMAHLRGDRERARRLFEPMLRSLPAETESAGGAAWVREFYAGCLAAEGRPTLAIPLLEASERAFLKTRQYWFDVMRVRAVLGDAYDRAGRSEDARRTLRASLDETVARRAADHPQLMLIRERWGRFLLTQGDLAGAEEQFREVLAQARERRFIHIALAYGGLARLALAERDSAAALNSSRKAVTRFDHASESIIDARSGPYLWLVHSAALLQSGDAAGARQWAEKALEASRRYDDPSSPAIAEAEAAVRAAASVSDQNKQNTNPLPRPAPA